ncbi:MAG: dihydroorotase [Alphaproteobacteria bacterium]|jgi:dihydroorotase|nr:dihydroorotase [Alphaproteobacteria bacterium]
MAKGAKKTRTVKKKAAAATTATAASRAAPRTAYVNARLIDPASGLDAPGGLLSEDGLIADFGSGLFADGAPENAETIDCRGRVLAPGLVDMRVRLRDPGHEHREATVSAAAGGITTIIVLPDTDPVIDSVALVEFIGRRAGEAGLINIYPMAALTQGLEGKEITEMGLMSEAGAVAFGDGISSIDDSLVMRRALSYASSFGLLIVQRPEDNSLASDGVMNEGEIATRLGLAGIPNAAETICLERDIRLLELTGGRYHASLLSTADSVDVVRRAKARGLNVTCDTAPPYFALNEIAVGDYRTFARLSPPLRCEEDRRAVVEGIEDGTIDAIVSDHAPHHQDSKRQPFAQAESGAVGLETLLAVALDLTRESSLPLSGMLGKVTCVPADILGLDTGRLRKGAAADLVIFDADAPWKIDADQLLSKSKNTPFDGKLTQGRVVRSVISGHTVFHASDLDA